MRGDIYKQADIITYTVLSILVNVLLDCFSFAIAKCTVSQNKSFPLRLLFGRRGRGSGGHDGSWKGQGVPAALVAGLLSCELFGICTQPYGSLRPVF